MSTVSLTCLTDRLTDRLPACYLDIIIWRGMRVPHPMRYHNSIHPGAQSNPANYQSSIHGEAIYPFIALDVETGDLSVFCETTTPFKLTDSS